MICIGNKKKNTSISVTNPKNIVVFAFYICARKSFVVLLRFQNELIYRVDSDKALNASSLKFFRSIERFVAPIFYPIFNVSLPLLF